MSEPMKMEPLLAALNQMRKDIGEDLTDPDYLALHHAFVFISYKTSEFAQYVTEADARGEFEEYKEDQI